MRIRWKLLVGLAVTAWVIGRPLNGQTLPAQTTGPVNGESQSAAALRTQPAFRELVDETGRTVRIPQPVRRIVSLAPNLTETVYALGLQDLLVGDTDYCDYPPDAQKKTKVGGAINPSLEQIARLQPDLVLMTKSLNRLETVRALEGLGIATYGTDPHTVDDIISSSQRLAELLGASEKGAAIASDMQKRLAELQGRLGDREVRRVLFIVWDTPLISVGKHTFIADALGRAGAVSVVDSNKDWPQVNLEEVVRLQPEYLVFATAHSEGAALNFDVLAARPGWRLLEAVRKRRYAAISDAVNRPAPRIVSAIEDLARQLHPGAFQENPTEKPKQNIAPVQEHFARVLTHRQNTIGHNPAQLAAASSAQNHEELSACAR
ncbi:MAG: ABC transporter substrate-binding protein [Candidatus Acidiferrum sp.]